MTAPVWGCPWHGKVQGERLTLPNGEEMPWPQPEGESPEDAGYTMHIKMPDVAPVQRTADELAADAARGMQWLDSAILAGTGTNATLHGKAVGGWIYADPDGARWLVKGLGPTSVSSGIVRTNLTLSRFGVLGGKPRSYSASANRSLSLGSGHYWQVQDVREGGDQAIVMVYNPSQKMWPRAFLLLTLSGTPGVDLTVTLTIIHNTSSTPATAISNATAQRMVPWHAYTDEQLGDLRWRVYTGSTVWRPQGEPGPPLHVSGSARWIFAGVSTFAASWPVAVWFNADGEPQSVFVRIDKTASMEFNATSTMTGADGPYGTADERVFSSRTVSDSIVTSSRVRIFSGSVVRTLVVNEVFSNEGQQTISNKPALDPDVNGTQTFSGSRSGDLPGASVEEVRELRVYTQSLEQLSPVAFGSSMTMQITGPVALGAYSIVPRRWSNNLVSVQMNASVQGSPSSWGAFWTDAFSPAGTVPGGGVEPGAEIPPYGSHNPITGEAIIGSAEPVSWT